jgi:hypothetical protein
MSEGVLLDIHEEVRAVYRVLASRDTVTLRDYFAGKVLSQCQITVEAGKDAPDDADIQATAARFARAAYVIADAMLRERERTAT